MKLTLLLLMVVGTFAAFTDFDDVDADVADGQIGKDKARALYRYYLNAKSRNYSHKVCKDFYVKKNYPKRAQELRWKCYQSNRDTYFGRMKDVKINKDKARRLYRIFLNALYRTQSHQNCNDFYVKKNYPKRFMELRYKCYDSNRKTYFDRMKTVKAFKAMSIVDDDMVEAEADAMISKKKAREYYSIFLDCQSRNYSHKVCKNFYVKKNYPKRFMELRYKCYQSNRDTYFSRLRSKAAALEDVEDEDEDDFEDEDDEAAFEDEEDD